MPKPTDKKYTQPQIKTKGEPWYIWYEYYNDQTGKWVLKIAKGGANYKDLPTKERLAQLEALKLAIEFKLEKQGWNPFTNTYPEKETEIVELETLQEMTLSQGLDWAYDQKKPDWSAKSRQDYTSKVKYIKESAYILSLLNRKVVEFKALHYAALLEHIRKTRGLSARGFNVYKDYLSALIGKLSKAEILVYNPVEKVEFKQVIKIKAHRPPTSDEKDRIISEIKADYRPYYRFLAVLYGCTIRPKEITGLKIKHLIKSLQIFRMTPDDQSSTKTKVEREPVIPDWVMDLLIEMNLDQFDPEWYIFSTRNKYRIGAEALSLKSR